VYINVNDCQDMAELADNNKNHVIIVTDSVTLCYRLEAFLEFNTVVEYNKVAMSALEFPAVTVCNFNK